jgi:serine/threonine-protein kinase RsbW
MDMIKLSVPGTLLYRDVVLRVAASSCRLVRSIALATRDKQEASRERQSFDDEVVSAVGEAFNNVAIHAYRGRAAGTVELEFEIGEEGITIRILDTGASFEPAHEQAPDLASLPESHMGLFIVRSFMDTVSYERGSPPARPNALTLTKRYVTAGR